MPLLENNLFQNLFLQNTEFSIDDTMGVRQKLHKLPKPARYIGSEPLNYTYEPRNYIIE